MTVPITKPVNWKVNYLKLERDGYNFKATFKVPSYMTDSESASRATWIDHEVRIDREGGARISGAYVNGQGGSGGSGHPIYYTDADRFWIGGQETNTSVEKNFDRTRYYPCKPGQTCHKALWGVFGGNSLSGRGFGASMLRIGPVVWAQYDFLAPRKPTVSWELGANNVATVTVKTDEGKDNHERYDTVYQVTIRRVDGTEATLRKWTATRATEVTATFDLTPYLANMAAGKYVTVKCSAYARGMAGDSATVSASRSLYWPSKATLGKVACTAKKPTGRITVPVTPGRSFASTTQLQLQRAASTDKNWDGLVPAGTWTDVSGATDNGDATALYDTYADANPQPGEWTFYRVVSTRDQFTQYSAAKRADCLYTAKPKETCSATCKIVSADSNSAGTAFTVVMAWKDGTANDGCELSMSNYASAWNSSSGPTVFGGITTEDSPTKLKGWHTKTYNVNDSSIEPGGTYYFRMRRYKEYDSGNTVYSSYNGAGVPAKAESATDDKCKILSIDVTGTTATVTVGINEDNVNDGTEITWADNPNAWRSNEQPNLFNAAWARSANTGSSAWPYKQVVYLRGLEEGKTYWVRARRYKAETYSGYSATKQFSIPAGAAKADYDPRCGLVSVTDAGDGESAVVVVGWSGDHTGCEVSWSTDADAWESSAEPQSTKFEWQDESRKSNAWSNTSTLYLRGLAEGETHYVRARTYFEGDGETAWSDYTDDITVTPTSAPESVTLTAPDAVARGESIECWWTLSGDMEQARWAVHRQGYPKKSLAGGRGSLCHATIPPSKYGNLDTISFYVDASTGGEFTSSNVVSVGIADYPGCEASCDATLTAQPASFEAYTDNDATSLLCTLRADGVTVSAPDGDRDQLPGDVVWTERVTPTWTATTWGATELYSQLSDAVDAAQDAYDAAEAAHEADPTDEDLAIAAENAATALADAQAALAAHVSTDAVNVATVTLPDTLDLWDGAGYTLSVQAVEPVAGLVSDTATCHMDVEWAHQAFAPAATLTVDSENRNVAITLQSGTPAADVDVTGESVEMGDGTFKSLVVDGKSVQDGTPTPSAPVPVQVVEGANLSGYEYTGSSYGVSFKYNGDGSVDVSGTATSSSSISINALTNAGTAVTLGAGTYTLSITGELTGTGGARAQAYTTGSTSLANTANVLTGTASASFTLTETTDVIVRVNVQSGYSVNGVAKMMLTAGTTATPYVPYGCIGLGVGKLLTLYKSNYYINASGVETANSGFVIYETTVDGGSTGTVGVIKRAGSTVRIHSYTADGQWIEQTKEWTLQATMPDGSYYTEITLPANAAILRISMSATFSNLTFGNVTPINLQGNVLASLPDGTHDELAIDGAGHVMITKNVGYIASYNGESVGSVYLSTTGSLTTGASVYYKLTTAQTIDLGAIALPGIESGELVSVSAAVTPSLTLTRHVDGFLSTDVCDVYRTTPAGHELVAESIPMGGELADPYAPFGTDDLHYRIALRTVDGDFEFADFPYALAGCGLRFDWAGKSVELPWNVTVSEAYAKDFETRSHADGSTEGYFGPAVGLTGSFSTDLIKVDDAQLRLVRELGSYPGAVFCRTSAGTAFQCNVDVSELALGYNSGAAAVSLDVTRVALTEQFKCNGGDA